MRERILAAALAALAAAALSLGVPPAIVDGCREVLGALGLFVSNWSFPG